MALYRFYLCFFFLFFRTKIESAMTTDQNAKFEQIVHLCPFIFCFSFLATILQRSLSAFSFVSAHFKNITLTDHAENRRQPIQRLIWVGHQTQFLAHSADTLVSSNIVSCSFDLVRFRRIQSARPENKDLANVFSLRLPSVWLYIGRTEQPLFDPIRLFVSMKCSLFDWICRFTSIFGVHFSRAIIISVATAQLKCASICFNVICLLTAWLGPNVELCLEQTCSSHSRARTRPKRVLSLNPPLKPDEQVANDRWIRLLHVRKRIVALHFAVAHYHDIWLIFDSKK